VTPDTAFALKTPASRRSEASEAPSAKELDAAREAVAALATAAKSFTLYPAGHVMAKKQIDTLLRSLAAFFEQESELALGIGRDGLTYRGNLLYEPLPADDPLIPPLLRDGFLWLAFRKGVDSDQIGFFLEVLNRYRILVDEPEGDLVTELWQADLRHICYDAIEDFWEVKPQFDFSHFQVEPLSMDTEGTDKNLTGDPEDEAPVASQSHGDTDTSQDGCSASAAIQIEQPTARRVLMHLSEKEKAHLKSQVENLDTQDNAAIVRDILLFTLAEQKDEGEFRQFLYLLQDLLFDLLYHRQPGHFHDLLRGLRVLQKKTRHPWQQKAVGEFIQRLSSETVWENQSQFFRDLHTLSAAEQMQTARFVNLLTPSFVAVLARELGQVRGSTLHQNLVAAAAKLASRDIHALERCISGSGEVGLRQMVLILGEMTGDRARALLERMSRHPAGAVRETAVKTLLGKSDPSVETLLLYLSDSHIGVRSAILEYIGRTKNAEIETALCDYIKNDPGAAQDEDHLIRCYNALGKCGGPSTVTFLGETLLNRSAGGLLQFGGNVHRVGAAQALRHCPGAEAAALLEKAAKSLFPAIRGAYRKAMRS
jgi:hypothetical protein